MTEISRHPASRNQHHLKPRARAVTRRPGLGITRESEQSTLFRLRNSVNLLLFHAPTVRYVVIELKAGRFRHEHAGQLGFYVAIVDDQLRNPARPTVGILSGTPFRGGQRR